MFAAALLTRRTPSASCDRGRQRATVCGHHSEQQHRVPGETVHSVRDGSLNLPWCKSRKNAATC